MFDLSKEKISIECPNCSRVTSATIGDVMNKRAIHCGCGTNIQLTDGDGSVRKGTQDINKAMKKLEDTFKKLGR